MKAIIFMLLGCGILSCQADQQELSEASKNTGFHNIGDHAYFFQMSVYMSVDDSHLFCEDLGMKLLDCDDSEKYQLIRSYISQSTEMSTWPYWTSGVKKDGVWVWSNLGGQEIGPYFAWGANQPDSTAEPACIYFRSYSNWQDEQCDWTGYPICE